MPALPSPQTVAAQVDAAQRALAGGDLATTERLCQSLITTVPNDGRAWKLLAETALRRSRPDAAIVCADRAVALLPGDPIAHIMHAKCLALTGNAQEALMAAETAARSSSASPEADDGIGAIFGMLGRHQRALAFFRRAVAARPDNAQFFFNLAATERMTGDLAASETHCDRAIALDRHFHRAYYLRSDLRLQTAAHNHIAEMEALIGARPQNWQGEVLLRYALGKECEDLGEFARAFRHIKAGADMQRSHLRYDVRPDIALIDAVIGTQTAAALQAAPSGFTGEAPVFIVGLPRSGTTLAERIVAGHPAIASAGELGVFPLMLSRQTAPPPKAGAGPDALARRWLAVDPFALGRAYGAAARGAAELPPGRFVDKFPGNYLHCGLLHRALPQAKIVLLRRNPMDSCYAIYKALFDGTNLFSYDLRELAAYYVAFRRLSEHWKATLPKTALLEIAYENIVHDLPGEARRLLAFLDLPWNDSVLRFHASPTPSATASAVQIRRPIYTSSIGKWRNVAAELAPLRAALETLDARLPLD